MKTYNLRNKNILSERNKNRHKEKRSEVYKTWMRLLQKFPILITYIAKTIEIRTLNAQIARVLRGRINKKLRTRHLKQTPSLDLIGCSVDELRTYIQNQWTIGMSWDNHGIGPGRWQYDHIISCCSFDLRDIDQQKKYFHYSNLQPMWFADHRRKTS